MVFHFDFPGIEAGICARAVISIGMSGTLMITSSMAAILITESEYLIL